MGKIYLVILCLLFVSCSQKSAGDREKADVFYNSALMDYMRGDLTASETKFRAIVKDYPNHQPAIIMLGKVLYFKNDFAGAEKVFQASLMHVNVDSYLWLSKIAGIKGDLKKSLVYLNQALELDYSSPETHLELGKAYRAAGQYDQSIYHFNYSLSLLRISGEARMELAEMYRGLNVNDKAEKLENEIIIDPNAAPELINKLTNNMKKRGSSHAKSRP